MGQRTCRAVLDEATVVENFLKLQNSCRALATGQIGLAANVRRIDAGIVELADDLAQLKRGRCAKKLDCGGGMFATEFELAANGGEPYRLYQCIQGESSY